MPGNSAVSGEEWGNVYAPYISVHWFIQILVCCSHCISHINRLIYVCLHVSVCTHIWKSLHACTYMRVCKHARPKQESKLSSVSTPKNCKRKYITKYIHLCLRTCISVSVTPRVYTELESLQRVCVCHCWQTGHIGRAGGGCSHAIPPTGLRTDTAQASDQRGPSLVRQPGSWCVCQCLWNMPLCLL